MYKFYIVPDASVYDSHAALYSNKQLLCDPKTESDAYALIGPKTKSEVNKAGSFEFTVLPANVHYNDFNKRKTVIIVYDDGDWLFEGVVSECSVDFYKQKKVTCSGVLSYLCDSIFKPDEKTILTVPDTGDKDRYVAVPSEWYYSGNPHNLGWAERNVENGVVYFTLTSDTSPNWSKQYYYRPDGGKAVNASGESVTKKIPTSESISDHLDRILDSHNEQVDAFKAIHLGQIAGGSDQHDFQAANYRTSWEAINSDIIEQYGRYLTITLENNELYLNYGDLDDLSSSDTPTIEYANNMIEMTEKDNSDELFTILLPTGKDNVTVSDASENSGGDDDDPYLASFGGNRWYVVVSRAALRRYGHIIKTQSFSDVETADDLYSRAKEYIENNYDFHNEYEVKGIDLHFIGQSSHRISIYDKCRVYSRWHQVDARDLYVISAERDLFDPSNDSYTIGVPTSDKEAKNKRITSRVNSNETNSKAAQASAASSSSTMGSILDNYIHVTEWGLEMNSRLKNEVEAENGKTLTRFLQDEEHINLAAQKMFGVDEDGRGDKDAGYVPVPLSDYKKSSGAYKSPVDEHWFEKVGNDYVLSKATTANPNVQYYVQRLWTRYSNIDVGPGGIKAQVDGNYDRSTASSTWIDMNENQLLAITGHLHVDEDGQVVIDSGAGAMTGKTIQVPDNRYKVVPKSWYSVNGGQTTSPSDRLWYEQNKEASGIWKGQDKSDRETNSEYYVRSRDTKADLSKTYYYYSDTKEEFLAEYGIYDGGNLNAGVIVGAVNNPQYIPVKAHLRSASGTNPNQLGWYVYNKETGEYAITLDTSVDPNTAYYVVDNNLTETYTDIWGEHIIIGRTVNYNGMDQKNKEKLERYLKSTGGRIDGTITEIASDVVVVNTLLAKYIEADEITAGTSLWAAEGSFNDLYVFGGAIEVYDDSGESSSSGTTLMYGAVNTDTVVCSSIVLDSESSSYIAFGNGIHENADVEADTRDPAEIIMGFGEITTSGDTVTIPYITAGDDPDSPDSDHVLSFDKPASIGRAVWSRASNSSDGVLKIYTIGGWNGGSAPQWTFYHAIVNIPGEYSAEDYKRKGSDFSLPAGSSSGLKTKPVIKARLKLTGDDYDRFGDPVAFGHDSSEDSPELAWSRDIYIDAKPAFDDGESYAKTLFGIVGPKDATTDNSTEAAALSKAKTLSYDSKYMFYSTYNNNRFSAKQYFKTPSKGSVQTYAKYGNKTYTSGTIPLGYSGSVTIYGQKKMDGETSWESATGIKVTAPPNNATSHDIQMGDSGTFETRDSEPDGTQLNLLRNAIYEAMAHHEWLRFVVTCGDSPKVYKMDFT